MAIIEPSLDFEGSHLGVRHDPDPGDYKARLVNVRFENSTGENILMDWVLTNHPIECWTWTVTRKYSKKAVGFLSKDLWWWKRKKWNHLGETLEERLEAMLTWIGDEANLRIANWSSENPSLVCITAVWSLNTPWPPPWAEDEIEED